MQAELQDLQKEVVKRIETRFMKKFHGNKSAFAKACSCNEKAIRKILRGEQFISVNLVFRICKALDTTISELFEELGLRD